MKDLDQGASSKGGYRQPPKMVNVVHKTNCGHHPDFHDPTPAKQNISVYYGEMIYGGVGFRMIYLTTSGEVCGGRQVVFWSSYRVGRS